MPRKVLQAIDEAASRFARDYARSQRHLVEFTRKLVEKGYTREQILATLSDAKTRAMLAEELGFNAAAKAALDAYGKSVLLNTKMSGPVTEEMLSAMTRLSQESFLAKANASWDAVLNEVGQVVLNGGSLSDFQPSAGLTVAQAETEAVTALSSYSRSLQAEMASNDPPDSLYVYEGPIDDRTRDECLQMAAAGELTKAEIDAQFPGAFIDGGGYNCRHAWVPVDAADMVNQEKAAEMLGTE